MMTFIPPRLRKPAASVLAGALFAAAWLVRGGPLWWVSILAVILAAGRAIYLYRLGGEDTDGERWPVPGPMSARSWSACGRGRWPAIWRRSPRSSA
jgi:hypothetical protein